MLQKHKNARDNRLVYNSSLMLKVSLIQNIGDEKMEKVIQRPKEKTKNDILNILENIANRSLNKTDLHILIQDLPDQIFLRDENICKAG